MTTQYGGSSSGMLKWGLMASGALLILAIVVLALPRPHATGDLSITTGESDSDGDGVLEDFDFCPGTLPGEEVDNVGCSLTVAAAAVIPFPATGTSFTKGSLTLTSNTEVTVQSFITSEKAVDVLVESPAGGTVNFSMSGLLPNKAFYVYLNGLEEGIELTSSGDGAIGFAAVTTSGMASSILIKDEPSTLTMYTSDIETKCNTYLGSWDAATLTCTMTNDYADIIGLYVDGATLDTNGHWIKGVELYHNTTIKDTAVVKGGIDGGSTGVNAYNKQNLTVQDINIKNVANAVNLYMADNSVVKDIKTDNITSNVVVMTATKDALIQNIDMKNTGNVGGTYGTGTGIAIQSASERITIDNANIDGKFYNGYMMNSNNVDITFKNGLVKGAWFATNFQRQNIASIEDTTFEPGVAAALPMLSMVDSKITLTRSNVSDMSGIDIRNFLYPDFSAKLTVNDSYFYRNNTAIQARNGGEVDVDGMYSEDSWYSAVAFSGTSDKKSVINGLTATMTQTSPSNPKVVTAFGPTDISDTEMNCQGISGCSIIYSSGSNAKLSLVDVRGHATSTAIHLSDQADVTAEKLNIISDLVALNADNLKKLAVDDSTITATEVAIQMINMGNADGEIKESIIKGKKAIYTGGTTHMRADHIKKNAIEYSEKAYWIGGTQPFIKTGNTSNVYLKEDSSTASLKCANRSESITVEIEGPAGSGVYDALDGKIVEEIKAIDSRVIDAATLYKTIEAESVDGKELLPGCAKNTILHSNNGANFKLENNKTSTIEDISLAADKYKLLKTGGGMAEEDVSIKAVSSDLKVIDEFNVEMAPGKEMRISNGNYGRKYEALAGEIKAVNRMHGLEMSIKANDLKAVKSAELKAEYELSPSKNLVEKSVTKAKIDETGKKLNIKVVNDPKQTEWDLISESPSEIALERRNENANDNMNNDVKEHLKTTKEGTNETHVLVDEIADERIVMESKTSDEVTKIDTSASVKIELVDEGAR
ncbi:MAG: hypothetical protein ABH846_00245, partial [Patescibacteria group bacterium]